MTRPKVDPDKRQRTAQACDSCKRRKQKCDGVVPCATCHKRSFECTYYTSDRDPHYTSSPLEHSTPKRACGSNDSSLYRDSHSRDTSSVPKYPSNQNRNQNPYLQKTETPTTENATKVDGYFSKASRNDAGPGTQGEEIGTPADGEEEADNHTMTRMLEDSRGRLLYIGDASTISFLQLIRMIIETAAGPSAFTLDPGRHRIIENQLNRSIEYELTYRLPDKDTALILVDSFFVNSYGMLEVFNEKTFLEEVHRCYSHPLSMDRHWLCLFFLVLAIGLSFATPLPGTKEASVIRDLRQWNADQSEVFYFNAKSLNDPLVGLEDSDFWSIQALTLMAVYMLARAMRNRAFAYVGMAIRSAYALGLHREETLVIFSPELQASRRMLWRSLFVLDRFLAASLGRPMAITEEESFSDILAPSTPATISVTGTTQVTPRQMCEAGMATAVRSGHVIGIILKKVYQKRKISTKIGQELADECIQWPQSLSPALHWRQASPNNVRQAIAILHTNLVYCHSIILLTRPFFLFLLSSEIQRTRLAPTPASQVPLDWAQTQRKQKSSKIKKFSDACIIASNHTIALVQNSYEGGYLPHQNPFSTYYLFAAALIVFANEFAHPNSDALSAQCMSNSIIILQHCGQRDPQAQRCALILREFRDVLVSQNQPPITLHHPPPPFSQPPPNPLTPGPLPPLPGATLPANDQTPPAFATSSNSTSAPFAPPPFATSTAPKPPPQLLPEDSFSGLLDLENTVLPTTVVDPDLSSSDEAIDFDALWEWPGGTPGIAGGTGV